MEFPGAAHHPYNCLLLLFFIFFLVAAAPLLSSADDEEDHLLQGINSFRQSVNAPALSKHGKADCIADQIADELQDRSCTSSVGPPDQSQLLSAYPDALRKCKVDINSTTDGMILPVCVPDRVPTLVLTNYTQSQNYSVHLNNTRYTGAGIGKEDDWTVLVLTTTTPAGSYTSGVGFCRIVMFNYLVSFFMLMVAVVINW